MDSALFYTFSTIAQTLGTAFALLAAFVLYRLQQVTTVIESASRVFIIPYLPNEGARRLRAQGAYQEMHALLSSLEPTQVEFTKKHSFSAARSALVGGIELQRRLKQLLRASLALSVLVIFGAVAVLPFAPAIAASEGTAWITLAIGLLAFGVCLGLYAFLIWQAVR